MPAIAPTLDAPARLRRDRRLALGLLFGGMASLAPHGARAADEAPDIEELRLPDARIELQFAPGFSAHMRQQALAWVTHAAQAIRAYFGRFPVAELELLLLPQGAAGIHSGTTFGEPAPYVRLRLGLDTSAAQMQADWVLVHEMVHLALPRLARAQAWLHEGAATYVEALARTHAGWVSPAQLWGGFANGMPLGQPRDGDLGLDHTPTWGRTYWGGALFCLLADVQLLQRSQGRAGLRQALQGVLAAGGSQAQAWPLERVLGAADAATGHTVLAELHAQMGGHAVVTDLEALWRRLGVQPQGTGPAWLDDAAPLARWRRAIEQASG